MVAILPVAALTASLDRQIRGAFIGIGFSIKVWPIALLAGRLAGASCSPAAPRRWRDRGGLAGATTLDHAQHAQPPAWRTAGPGHQVRSMAATPFGTAARYLGLSGQRFLHLGTARWNSPRFEVETPPSSPIQHHTRGRAAIVMWLPAGPPDQATFYDAALTTVLFLVLTSRVLSPSPCDLAHPGLALSLFSLPRSSRSPGCCWRATADRDHLSVGRGHYSSEGRTAGTLILAARNAVLLVAAVESFRTPVTTHAAPGRKTPTGKNWKPCPTS